MRRLPVALRFSARALVGTRSPPQTAAIDQEASSVSRRSMPIRQENVHRSTYRVCARITDRSGRWPAA
jgi:hypothetical protein